MVGVSAAMPDAPRAANVLAALLAVLPRTRQSRVGQSQGRALFRCVCDCLLGQALDDERKRVRCFHSGCSYFFLGRRIVKSLRFLDAIEFDYD